MRFWLENRPAKNKELSFFDFRNSLVHRYWIVDDRKLIENIQKGHKDFDSFIDEIEAVCKKFLPG